jgi:hypothetical protein
METLNTVLVALGLGDRVKGARVAAVAVLMAFPGWLALAIVLSLGARR